MTIKSSFVLLVRTPPRGWEEQIKKALAEHGEDVDVDWLSAPLRSKFEEKEWTW